MKMSTRGRYGLRAMLELARCHGQSPVLMSSLAKREAVSRKYLHGLLTALKKAELVRSIRGPGGGFVLAREPSKIRLSQVLHALEGPLSLVDCVADRLSCSRVNSCTAHRVWEELSETIENALDGVTLEDLIESENQTCSPPEVGERKRIHG
jgi:Rrf2 family cysteine metabolism transcriptional repressor